MQLELNGIYIVVGIFCIILGYIISWVRFKNHLSEVKGGADKKSEEGIKNTLQEYKSSPELAALLDLRFRDGQRAGSAEAIDNYKKSEGYEALFLLEHSKGRDVGIEEERNRWELVYTPIVISDDGFFSHTLETGYEMQIFYAGFPINDPLRRITGYHKKSKDDNINKFLDIAEKAVDVAVVIATKNKIPVSVKKSRQEKKIEEKK